MLPSKRYSAGMFHFCYLPQTKLLKGKVFTGVCLFTGGISGPRSFPRELSLCVCVGGGGRYTRYLSTILISSGGHRSTHPTGMRSFSGGF